MQRLGFLNKLLFVCVVGGLAVPGWAFQKTTDSGIWIAKGVRELPHDRLGPFTRLRDGAILTVNESSVLISHDGGGTWQSFSIFGPDPDFKIRPERALISTRNGVIVLAFANENERANWDWNPEISDSPGARLPTYAVRSLDGGKTWQDLQKLHDSWTGAIRDMIETADGKVVFTTMMMQHDPGRHSVLTYVSEDDGESWTRSNVIDLGGVGHHGGVSEATVVQLRDGRLWKLIRTNWKVFWEAYSEDGGYSWRTIGPSQIDASSAPGFLKRLASGRLVLVWNRLYPEGSDEYPLRGGDKQWSEVPVSNHREELSIAFSEDDGRTWSQPVVIARNPGQRVSYPYVFEAHPGELWITTMQGELRVSLREADFFR